jgi:hypothetical protein
MLQFYLDASFDKPILPRHRRVHYAVAGVGLSSICCLLNTQWAFLLLSAQGWPVLALAHDDDLVDRPAYIPPRPLLGNDPQPDRFGLEEVLVLGVWIN